MPTTADDFELLDPRAAQGEDVVIDLTGPTDPSGWTLAAVAGYAPSGPPEDLDGLTAVALGDDGNTIRVTLPKAVTGGLPMREWVGEETLYLEVWRTNTGDTRPLARLALPYYDPIRTPG